MRWPRAGSEFPPSAIRTIHPERPLKIVFGSCRVAVPHEEPWNLSPDEDERGREVDALYALALRMMEDDRVRVAAPAAVGRATRCTWTRTRPTTREFIRSRRDISLPPGEEVADFEEYTHLYWESWGDPT